MPTLRLNGEANTRISAISDFILQFGGQTLTARGSNVGSLFKVYEPIAVNLPLMLDMPAYTTRLTSFQYTVAYNKQVEQVNQIVEGIVLAKRYSSLAQLEALEGFVAPTTLLFGLESTQLALEALGCAKSQVRRLSSKVSELSSPREVLAVLSQSVDVLGRDVEVVMHPTLSTHLPSIAASASPKGSLLPFLFCHLPAKFSFSYTDPMAGGVVSQSWVYGETTLGERCHAAIIRLAAHYSAELVKRRNAGLSYDRLLVEFSRLGYVIQNYASKVSVAEAFELSAGCANAQMYELAQDLLGLETSLIGARGVTLEIATLAEPLRYGAHPYSFYAVTNIGVGVYSAVPSHEVIALQKFATQISHYSSAHQVDVAGASTYYAAGHPLAGGWLSAVQRLAGVAFTGFTREIGPLLTQARGQAVPLPSAQHISSYRSWSRSSSGAEYFKG